MRISDWSSDVCSSDLRRRQGGIEAGKEDGLAKIARRYLEVAGRGRRVEFLFGPDLLAIDGNHVLDGRGQLVCKGRGLHSRPRPHEKRIVEMLPQLPEPATQCGLRHGQKARGDADVAMLVDRKSTHLHSSN